MAKVQSSAAVSLPPERLGAPQGVFDADAQDVAETQNLASGYSLTHAFANLVTADAGWGGSGNEVATHTILCNASSGYSERYRGQIYIDPDAASVSFRTVGTCPAANTFRVRIAVGATNIVLATHTAGATTTSTGTLATSATGTGLVAVTVELDHLTGSSTLCSLDRLGWRNVARTTSLPDPSG